MAIVVVEGQVAGVLEVIGKLPAGGRGWVLQSRVT